MPLNARESSKTALEIALKRAGLLLLAFDLSIVVLYAAGTRQGFLDETQAALVALAGPTSWTLVLVAVAAAVSRAALPPARRERPALGAAAAWLAAAVLGTVLAIAVGALEAFSSGIPSP